MTSQPFDAECRAHLAAQARDAGPWDPAWPLARQREAWEAACRKARARRPDRLMVEDMAVDGIHLRIYRPPGDAPALSPSALNAATAASARSAYKSLTTTRAPCRASMRATPSPMPRPAPVTSATRPSSRKLMVSVRNGFGCREHAPARATGHRPNGRRQRRRLGAGCG